jgi:hypothetical protein
MSGTSAGARRGWKTRKRELPPVSAGRKKNPIRQKAGARAHETRKLHEGNRAGAVHYGNMKNSVIRRMELRGQISAAQADEAYKASQAEYERQLRMNPVRHRKRGR